MKLSKTLGTGQTESLFRFFQEFYYNITTKQTMCIHTVIFSPIILITLNLPFPDGNGIASLPGMSVGPLNYNKCKFFKYIDIPQTEDKSFHSLFKRSHSCRKNASPEFPSLLLEDSELQIWGLHCDIPGIFFYSPLKDVCDPIFESSL